MSHNAYLCEEDQAEGAFDDAPLWGCWCSHVPPVQSWTPPTCGDCGSVMVEVDADGERVTR